MEKGSRLNSAETDMWKGGVVMPYSYKKLLGKIVEVYGTQAKFAEALNLSERLVSLKLNGKVEWKQGEMLGCPPAQSFSG